MKVFCYCLDYRKYISFLLSCSCDAGAKHNQSSDSNSGKICLKVDDGVDFFSCSFLFVVAVTVAVAVAVTVAVAVIVAVAVACVYNVAFVVTIHVDAALVWQEC